MRVLVANIPLPENRFLVDLNEALAAFCEIEQSSEAFWQMTGDYDVVHLHFPEYLTFELTGAYVGKLSSELIEAVEERLRYWVARASIVVTRHVLLPHDAVTDPQWERMYETVYRYSNGVVHFGRASETEFRSRYQFTSFVGNSEPLHAVIPHQNYASLPNEVDRSTARQRLGLSDTAEVMLVFGAIRSDVERKLILDTFRASFRAGRVLLVSRWKENLADVSWIRLKYWIRDLLRLYYRLRHRYSFNYSFVQEADTQLYLNAADVLFIPRLRVLNSGNITLGMTFGRVVVGPDSWDVGEILRETGNPTFDPDNPESATQALNEGFRLAAEGLIPARNRAIALREWTPEACALRYFEFFSIVTGARSEVQPV